MKTNTKPIQNLPNTLEFEFERHLEHMVSYQEMQSGLTVFLVEANSVLSRFSCKCDWQSLAFHVFLQLETSEQDHIWKEYNHILPFTNHKSTLV